MIPVLGGDPGHEGAAVLLAPSVLVALSWQRRERKSGDVYLCTALDGSQDEDASLHEVAQRVLGELAHVLRQRPELCPALGHDLGAKWYHLAVEGLFVPWLAPDLVRSTGQASKYMGRVKDIVTLGETAGELIGPLRYQALSVTRPKAVTWRASVLPKGWGQSSDEAERAALAVCRALYPSLGLFLSCKLDADGCVVPLWPHVVEAACIARHGWVEARGAAQVEMVGGRRR